MTDGRPGYVVHLRAGRCKAEGRQYADGHVVWAVSHGPRCSGGCACEKDALRLRTVLDGPPPA